MYRLAVLAALLLLGWRFVSPLSWVSLRSREPSSPEQDVGLADLTKNGPTNDRLRAGELFSVPGKDYQRPGQAGGHDTVQAPSQSCKLC